MVLFNFFEEDFVDIEFDFFLMGIYGKVKVKDLWEKEVFGIFIDRIL